MTLILIPASHIRVKSVCRSEWQVIELNNRQGGCHTKHIAQFLNASNNDFSVLFFIVNRSLEIAEKDGGYYGKLFDYHQTLLCFFDGGFVDRYSNH